MSDWYGDAKGASECNLCFVLFSIACLFLPCLFNPPPTTILHPVCNNVPDIFLQDRGNLGKAKIKRRLLDYSLTCVLLYDSAREAETKQLDVFWQTLAHHGVRCTEALWLQYHVWTGMNTLIACFILNSQINSVVYREIPQCHHVKWFAKTSPS